MKDYGKAVFTVQPRNGPPVERSLPLAPIQRTIVQMILMGCVIQTEKTKHGTGKQAVSIGPYKRATDDRTHRYAVFIGASRHEFLSPVEAARFFINWCNHYVARDAVKEYCRKNRA